MSQKITNTPSRENRKRKSVRFIRSLLLGTTLFSVGLSTAGAESLSEALISTYNSNPTLLAERAGLKAVGENVRQAQAGWLPTVTLQGSLSKDSTDTNTFTSVFDPASSAFKDVPDPEVESAPLTGSASISMPIFSGGQTFYGTRAAKAQTRAAKANLKSVEQQVLFDGVTAYYDVLRDMSVVELSKNNVQVLERQLQAAQDRFRVGEITRTDVAQAEARLSGSRSRLTQSEAALIASRSAYERVVGHLPVNMGKIGERPEITALPKTEEEAISIALQSNPALKAAREREIGSRESAKATRGALLPQVSVRGTISTTTDQDFDPLTSRGFEETDVTSLSGQVTVPLYQGGAAYSRLRQAKQTNSQNRIQIAETERRVREQVINAWEGLRSTQATIISSQEQVRANEIAFEGVQQEAQVGSRTTLNVLDAEQELLDAKVTLVGARRNEMVAAYALLASVGRLNASDLGLAVSVYKP